MKTGYRLGAGKSAMILALLLACAFAAGAGGTSGQALPAAAGPTAYVSSLDGLKLFVVDLGQHAVVATIALHAPVTGSGSPFMNDVKMVQNRVFVTLPGLTGPGGEINAIKTVDVRSNAVIDSVATWRVPTGLALYNGKLYVVDRYSSSVQEIDPSTNAILRTIPFSSSYPSLPLFLEVANGKIYLPCPGSGGSAGGVEVLDLVTGAAVKSISFASVDFYGPIGIMKVGPDKLYVGSMQDVGVIDAVSDSLVTKIRVKPETAGKIYRFAAAGNKVYTANAEGTSSVIDATADTLMGQIAVAPCQSCAYLNLGIASSGGKLYMSVPDRGIRVIDTQTDMVVDSMALPGFVGAMSVMDTLESGVIGIQSLTDVPNDQGKQIQVVWERYGGESGTSYPVKQYGVWRMDGALPGGTAHEASPAAGLFAGVSSLKAIKPGEELSLNGEIWSFVGWTPVSGFPFYALNVPTLFDSTVTDGMHWSKFMVSGHASDFTPIAWSKVDSGYSVDNLAPLVPSGLTATAATTVGGSVVALLRWSPKADADLKCFAVYRGTSPDFTPRGTEPVARVGREEFADWGAVAGTRYYYRVSAIDFSGNESGYSNEVNFLPTGESDKSEGIPAEFALHQNYPNPFNPAATIGYAVAKSSLVRIAVYDLLGREVALLVNETRQAGNYRARWDASGMPSGLYICRMDAVGMDGSAGPDFHQVRKMLLAK